MVTDKTKRNPTFGYGDYLRFSRLVNDVYGLSFPAKRRADLEQGIRTAFAASPCENLDSYYHLLLDPAHSYIHRQRLVNVLTVGESHFFRDAGQFEALRSHVLPQIINRRRPLRTLRVWSAGCAEGQEPYSVAMLLADLLPDVEEWAITILGTDVNTAALERAQRGIYSEWAFREPLAHAWRDRFFRPAGSKRYELLPEIRRMVSFSQLNLADNVYPSFQTNTTYLDLILCRNVTIYLAPELTHEIVQRFYNALVDGGWLVVGHSEHSLVTYRQFQARNFPDAILYERTGCPSPLPEGWNWLLPENQPVPVSSPDTTLNAGPMQSSLSDGPLTQLTDIPGSTPLESASVPKPAAPPQSLATAEHRDQTPESDRGFLARAEELLEYGHADRACDLLLEQDPQDARTAVLLGQAYADQGAWEEAETWCRRAIELDRLQPEPYYILALVQQHQGLLPEALISMRKAVYLDNTSIRCQYGLANLHHGLGQLPQALKALDNARRILMSYTNNQVLPQTGGITVGAMRQAISQQFQQWSAEAVNVKDQAHPPVSSPEKTR